MTDTASIDQLPAERVVAFVDILGFRSVLKRIFREKDVALYSRFRKALSEVSGHAKITNQPLFDAFVGVPHTARATAFSDCIVFSDEPTDLGAYSIVSKVSLLATWLLRDGILCRGAIVSGSMLHEDDILLGEGLVKAYELENSAAVYPRIILSDSIVPRVRQGPPFVRIRTDVDGFHFIDPFFGLQKARVLEASSLASIYDPPEWDRAQFKVVARHTADELRHLQGSGDGMAGPLAKWRWFASWLDIAAREYVNASYEELLREVNEAV